MKHCFVTAAEIASRQQCHRVSFARQIVWAHLRHGPPKLSFPAIGRMHGRDHTTIIAGLRGLAGKIGHCRTESDAFDAVAAETGALYPQTDDLRAALQRETGEGRRPAKAARLDPEKLAAAYRNGASIKAIAQREGVGAATVSRALKRHGLSIRKGFHGPQERARKMVALHRQGVATAAIAERFGVRTGRVQQAVRRWGGA